MKKNMNEKKDIKRPEKPTPSYPERTDFIKIDRAGFREMKRVWEAALLMPHSETEAKTAEGAWSVITDIEEFLVIK